MDEYFEKGYHIDRYHALEEDLLRFLDYVTLEFYPKPQNQKYIRSIYLADLMLRIGSNIGIFFDKFIEGLVSGEIRVADPLFSMDESRKAREELREIKQKNSSNPKWQGWNWNNYQKLDPILILSDRHVLLIPLNEIIYPFKYNGKSGGKSWMDIKKSDTTFWWNSYNKIKHNAAFKGANLNNVLQALAALFVLSIDSNFIYSEKARKYNYIKTYYSEQSERQEIQEISTRLFSR
jgi:hypothetical protein